MNFYYLDATKYVLGILDDMGVDLGYMIAHDLIQNDYVMSNLPLTTRVKIDSYGYLLLVTTSDYQQLFMDCLANGIKLLECTEENLRILHYSYMPANKPPDGVWYIHQRMMANLETKELIKQRAKKP